MSNAPRDNNRVPAVLATSNADGITVLPVYATPARNALRVSAGTSGTGFSYANAQRDANRIPALWAVSSTDGITPIPIYCDSNNKLLVKTV